MANEAKREPTLEDVRNGLANLLRLVGTVNQSIDHVHTILDKELYARHVEKEPETVSSEMPNLRFDMNIQVHECIGGLEGCLKNLESLKAKMRNPSEKPDPLAPQSQVEHRRG